MIPSDIDLFDEDLEDEDDELEPSKTYQMDIESNKIRGYADELDAVRQAVYKILNTERYEYIIYSWNYGIELIDLYGEDDTFVIPELQRRIIDALSVDDRILSCEEFDFDVSQKNIVIVTFKANTIYGDIDVEKVVNI